MKTGILWDLDGTLLDTLEDLCDGVNHALHTQGLPERTLAEVRRFVGNGAGNLILRAVEGRGDAQAVLEIFRPYYDAHCQQKTRPYGGIPEALAVLGKKYPMAIVSNKPDSAVKSLCARYFPGMFALGETPDCPRKPAPDMVYKAMEAIGVENCVYVGDSEVDVITARNAGAPCLSVLWGFRDREDMEAVGGTHFCDTPEKLVQTLEMLIQSLQASEKR